jgi:hypothetical protein
MQTTKWSHNLLLFFKIRKICCRGNSSKDCVLSRLKLGAYHWIVLFTPFILMSTVLLGTLTNVSCTEPFSLPSCNCLLQDTPWRAAALCPLRNATSRATHECRKPRCGASLPAYWQHCNTCHKTCPSGSSIILVFWWALFIVWCFGSWFYSRLQVIGLLYTDRSKWERWYNHVET